MPNEDKLKSDLETLAVGAIQNRKFSANRTQRIGTPALWAESIEFSLGGKQFLSRIRSPVDEGGGAIGKWSSPADARVVKALAEVCLQVSIWDIEDEPPSPGQEITTWEIVTDNAKKIVTLAGGSPKLMSLINVDIIFRRLANVLEQGRQGAVLVCELIIKSVGSGKVGRIVLENTGNQDFLVPNPFKVESDNCNFTRVEVGAVPVEVPGTTSADIEYRAVAARVEDLAPPWDRRFVRINKGQRLGLPISFDLSVTSAQKLLARAIFSNYAASPDIDGVPVIHGRVFSQEIAI